MDSLVEMGIIKYVDCDCVEIAKQFNMHISCPKCGDSRKKAIKTDNSIDDIVVSICENCDGYGVSIKFGLKSTCQFCNGKGYTDWLDKVIIPEVVNF